MKHTSLDNIYNQIMLLSNSDKERLYRRMQEELDENQKIVAYTTAGKPLTRSEYIEEINIGLRQIENGDMLTDEELQKEIDTW